MKGLSLSKSEQQKAFLFLALVFVMGNIYGLQWLFEEQSRLDLSIGQLRSDKTYNQAWVADKNLWGKRAAWLSKNQPKFDDSGQGNVHLLEKLQGMAKANNITIAEPTLLDPKNTSDYQEVSVQLQLIGSLESIVRLISGLQQPDQFHAITSLSIKSDSDITKVRCELRITTWNKPKA